MLIHLKLGSTFQNLRPPSLNYFHCPSAKNYYKLTIFLEILKNQIAEYEFNNLNFFYLTNLLNMNLSTETINSLVLVLTGDNNISPYYLTKEKLNQKKLY